ncbi:hypothetical protein [Methylocystis heyeri]|uniref:Uncharacterized protein n=1 Tax=Methylocystis heyeri TaxID=391905 RepID=A0A6B8KES6_9HYPH|nr:hypothetical protein [Methylocystis heyeri]QGM46129.1 hypothetical protein H2LOC_010720 [Methylocystis heyeri]
MSASAYPSIPQPDGTPSGNAATLLAMKRVVELLVVNAGGNDTSSGAAFANAATVDSVLSGNKALNTKQTTLSGQVSTLTTQQASTTTQLSALVAALGALYELSVSVDGSGSHTLNGVTTTGNVASIFPLIINANASINGLLVQARSLSQADAASGVGPVSVSLVARTGAKVVIAAAYAGGQTVSSGNVVTLDLIVDGTTIKQQPVPVVSGSSLPAIAFAVVDGPTTTGVSAKITQTGANALVGLQLLAVELAR